MDRETTLILNFQQTSYQTIDKIIQALRLLREKKVLERKSIIQQELPDGVTTPSKAPPVADLPNSQLKKDGVKIVK